MNKDEKSVIEEMSPNDFVRFLARSVYGSAMGFDLRKLDM